MESIFKVVLERVKIENCDFESCELLSVEPKVQTAVNVSVPGDKNINFTNEELENLLEQPRSFVYKDNKYVLGPEINEYQTKLEEYEVKQMIPSILLMKGEYKEFGKHSTLNKTKEVYTELFNDLGKITIAGNTPASGELDIATVNAGNIGIAPKHAKYDVITYTSAIMTGIDTDYIGIFKLTYAKAKYRHWCLNSTGVAMGINNDFNNTYDIPTIISGASEIAHNLLHIQTNHNTELQGTSIEQAKLIKDSLGKYGSDDMSEVPLNYDNASLT
ncbi:hypothetical protein WN48_02215 [Eufriesea mexicana]|uniref:Uncharacterized protein n=1 Tax=Eufriesea mexicana TaxID=516756 RepID=A0A310S4R5_9HYME|nr:hypothetical protein WN48_02215 [Eufriesea mexicana]